MIATYLIRCNALSRRSMKTVTVLFFVAILAMIEIHQSRKQTNDIPIYSEEANGLSNFHVIVTTSNQSYINAHSEYVLPTNAEDKKNQIPTTPKNNRSSSLSFEYDIDIVSPEHTRAMILRSVFRKVSKSKQLFHLIHTTNEGNFGTMQKRCLESIFYHHPDAKVLLHVRKMSDKPVRYLRNAGYDLQTRSYDPVKSLKRLQRQRIVPRHILNAFMNRVDEYESDSQGYWFSNESNLQRMILMYIDGGIYLGTTSNESRL